MRIQITAQTFRENPISFSRRPKRSSSFMDVTGIGTLVAPLRGFRNQSDIFGFPNWRRTGVATFGTSLGCGEISGWLASCGSAN